MPGALSRFLELEIYHVLEFDWSGVMPDNLKNAGPEDGWRISLTQPHEVRYWTKALGVNREMLSEIVSKVGNTARAVRAEIRRRDQATVPPSGDNEGA